MSEIITSIIWSPSLSRRTVPTHGASVGSSATAVALTGTNAAALRTATCTATTADDTTVTRSSQQRVLANENACQMRVDLGKLQLCTPTQKATAARGHMTSAKQDGSARE